MAPQKTFLYEDVKASIEQHIRDGTFTVGSRMPSIPQLSDRFSVSEITVRRALGELEQNGILIRRHGSGTFVVDNSGNGGSNSRLIGVAVRGIRNITHNYMAQIIAGISSVASEADYHVDFSDTAARESESHFMRALRSKQPIGLLVIDQNFLFEEVMFLKQAGVPYILVDQVMQGLKSNVVTLDYAQGVRDACDLLIRRGHRRIAIVLRTLKMSDDYRRLQGYREALEAAGLPLDEELVVVVGSSAVQKPEVAATVQSLLRDFSGKADPPTAFVFPVDPLAIETVHNLMAQGVRIPEAAAVVGFNDMFAETFERPRLTRMVGDFGELGRTAARRLIEIVQGGDRREQTVNIDMRISEGSTA